MVNTYKLKLTILQQGILRLLIIRAGVSMNQREIATFLDVSSPAVMKAIPELQKIGFVKTSQDKKSGRWSIELNRDNHRVLQIKRADNLRQVYESGFADFIDREFAGATIILFGSYSRGEDVWFGEDDDKNSDIDIAVVGRKEKNVNLEAFEKILEREIFINFYESWDKIHNNLRNNILNGIILSGSVDL